MMWIKCCFVENAGEDAAANILSTVEFFNFLRDSDYKGANPERRIGTASGRAKLFIDVPRDKVVEYLKSLHRCTSLARFSPLCSHIVFADSVLMNRGQSD